MASAKKRSSNSPDWIASGRKLNWHVSGHRQQKKCHRGNDEPQLCTCCDRESNSLISANLLGKTCPIGQRGGASVDSYVDFNALTAPHGRNEQGISTRDQGMSISAVYARSLRFGFSLRQKRRPNNSGSFSLRLDLRICAIAICSISTRDLVRVPDLISAVGINLNARVSLRPCAAAVRWEAPDICYSSGTSVVKVVGRSHSARRFVLRRRAPQFVQERPVDLLDQDAVRSKARPRWRARRVCVRRLRDQPGGGYRRISWPWPDFPQLAIDDPVNAPDRNPCKPGFGLAVECMITDLIPEAIVTGLIAF